MDDFTAHLREDELARLRTFFPYALRRIAELGKSGKRLVHYTSSAVGLSIMQKKEVWLRNARFMNDFSEIEHGFSLLRTTWESDAGKALRGYIDRLHPNLSEEFEEYFISNVDSMINATYLTCLSEHHDAEVDRGRLSMWRAYGSTSGVAIVFKPDVFISSDNAILTAYTSPVLYAEGEEYYNEFEGFVRSITGNRDYMESLSRDEIRESLSSAYLFACLATKNPAFGEEIEWRVTHSPRNHPSKHISKSIEIVRGEPQIVHKIRLQNITGEIARMDISEL